MKFYKSDFASEMLNELCVKQIEALRAAVPSSDELVRLGS